MHIIKVNHITKTFRHQERKPGLKAAFKNMFNNSYTEKNAVDDISFEIEKGEIVGYLGPNGAGKSTTIKMMSGILIPTKGNIEVNSLVPYKQRQKNARQIGVVFGQRTQLWWDIPMSETFDLLKTMYKISDKQYEENMEIFNDILNIHSFIKLPVRQLSLGQRMRADLCAALLHNPEILYLDEPTIGLDIIVKTKIREFIKELNKQKKTTIMLTTHDLLDIESLCSKIIVIDNGHKVYDGNLEELMRFNKEKVIIVESEKQLDELKNNQYFKIKNISYQNGKNYIVCDNNNNIPAQIVNYILNNYKVKDIVVRESTIEEIVKKIYMREM